MRIPAMVLTALMAFGLLAASPAAATVLQVRPNVLQIDPGRIVLARRTANRTTFDPTTQGFQFANEFANNFIPEFDWRTDGLCGGMIFAVLDYLNNPHIPIPRQDYLPADGTVLRDYIYARQTNSIVDHNHVNWSEYGLNPFGARNAEFYRWGLEGRLDDLRREIDAGRPVPIGLKGCDEGCMGDHMVLAIGYDVGDYNGDPTSPTARNVRIFVYDPNIPNETQTFSPFPDAGLWGHREGDERWRSWFIAQYSVRTPPLITPAPRELLLTFDTGGDDLRGTNDNLNVHILTRTGRTLTFNNVNQGHPWINNSRQQISITLPEGVRPVDVRGVRLETTATGGWNGDNWNMEGLSVDGIEDGVRTHFFHEAGTPLFRFTGEQRTREFLFCPSCS